MILYAFVLSETETGLTALCPFGCKLKKHSHGNDSAPGLWGSRVADCQPGGTYQLTRDRSLHGTPWTPPQHWTEASTAAGSVALFGVNR